MLGFGLVRQGRAGGNEVGAALAWFEEAGSGVSPLGEARCSEARLG